MRKVYRIHFGFLLMLALIVVQTGVWGNRVQAATDVITVAQAIANNRGSATVEGYIIGTVSNGPSYQLTVPFTVESNLALADSSSETVKQNILPVQLPSGSIRTALNLKSNAGLLGKKVRITGNLEAYFGVPGLKSPTAYELVNQGDPDPDIQVIPIDEAKQKTNQTVTIEGVITADNDAIGGGRVSTYVQDATGGINLFAFNPAGFPDLKEGDQVRVTGAIQEYRGLTEIVPLANQVKVLAEDQPLPDPLAISIEDLEAAEWAEEHEGKLVQTTAYVLDVPEQLAGGGYNVSILDENYHSTTLRVMPPTGVYEELEPETWYTITAVLSQFDSYQLIPRKTSDVEKLDEQKPAPKPAEFYSSQVASVVDGDTVHLTKPVLGATKVRFVDIDTPETYHTVVTEADRSQKEHGEAAKAYLNSLLKNGDEVEIKVAQKPFDDYGRLLAQIIRKQDQLNVNLEMVKSGYASTYFIWPIDEEDYSLYSQAVKEAYDAGLGIWNPDDPLQELPFVFRAREQGKGLTRYVGNHSTKVYVDPTEWESVPVEERVFFASPSEAESAGYSRDASAPVTSVKLSTQPNTLGWWNQNVTVELNAEDDGSGISATEYQINGGEWSVYKEPFTVSQEGENIIGYRSTDRAGNVEETHLLTLKIDTTAPIWELTQSGQPVHDVSATEKISFNLQATDAISGVQSVQIIVDGQPIENNHEYPADQFGLGEHTIHIAVKDQADNQEEKQYRFQVLTSIVTIKTLVDELTKQQEIKNQGIAKSIQAKLDTALRALDGGKPSQAQEHVKQLSELITQYVQVGNMTSHAGEVLQTNLAYLLANGIK